MEADKPIKIVDARRKTAEKESVVKQLKKEKAKAKHARKTKTASKRKGGDGHMKFVIAEKPSVAQSLAKVIGANERKDGYLEGNGYIVSWCVGHLIELGKTGNL